MTGYTPEQMPVLSTLARGFATFDHWFCEVPSCTFPNRSFFHAATSSGYVVNMTPPESFIAHNTAETLFDRLESHGLSWRVYCDPPSHYSLTGLIHAPRLRSRFADPFFLHRPVLRGCRARCAADLCVHRAADHRPRPQRHASRLRHAHPRPHLGPAVVADRRRRPARPPLPRDPILVLPDWVELPEHHPSGGPRSLVCPGWLVAQRCQNASLWLDHPLDHPLDFKWR
jgi:hypothetical protein